MPGKDHSRANRDDRTECTPRERSNRPWCRQRIFPGRPSTARWRRPVEAELAPRRETDLVWTSGGRGVCTRRSQKDQSRLKNPRKNEQKLVHFSIPVIASRRRVTSSFVRATIDGRISLPAGHAGLGTTTARRLLARVSSTVLPLPVRFGRYCRRRRDGVSAPAHQQTKSQVQRFGSHQP